jgi:hypothetical protein
MNESALIPTRIQLIPPPVSGHYDQQSEVQTGIVDQKLTDSRQPTVRASTAKMGLILLGHSTKECLTQVDGLLWAEGLKARGARSALAHLNPSSAESALAVGVL